MDLTKSKIIDFTVLVLRWYLAIYMLDYGIGKLLGDQFGSTTPEILNSPLKDVDKFHLAWHLFGLSRAFNVIIGITQIAAALLLVINRTLIIGALVLMPVLIHILLLDVTFTMDVFGPALPIRIAIMIICDLAVLFYYRDRINLAWKNLTENISTKLKYKWWIYLLVPVIAFLLDFIFAAMTIPLKILLK